MNYCVLFSFYFCCLSPFFFFFSFPSCQRVLFRITLQLRAGLVICFFHRVLKSTTQSFTSCPSFPLSFFFFFSFLSLFFVVVWVFVLAGPQYNRICGKFPFLSQELVQIGFCPHLENTAPF